MNIENLSLTNFQSFTTESLSFNDGVTLIHGQNGAGKSTILRAIFAGLYQADAKSETSAEYNLVDFVRKGEDEARVELTFSISGVKYTIEWELSVTEDDDGERKASTKSCVLTSPVHDDPIEGVRNVREAVEEDLLGMGATEFANSVYVQQKRLSRLIEADESERKEILDSLLGFNQLDVYTERMQRARRPAKRVRNDAQSRRSEVQERIEQYDEAELRAKKQEYEDEVSEYESEYEQWDTRVGEEQRRVDTLKDRLDEYEQIVDDIGEIETKIEDKEDDIESLNDEIQQRSERIDEIRNRIDGLEAEIDALELDDEEFSFATEDDAKDAKETLDTRWKTAYEAEQTASNAVERHRDTVNRLEQEHEAATDELETARDEYEAAETTVDEAGDQVKTCREAVDDATADRNEAVADFLDIEEGDVSDDSRTAVEDEIDAADTEREEIGNRISELKAERTQVKSQRDDLAEDIETAREEYDTLSDKVDLDEATDPQTEFDRAVEAADELGTTFGVDVDADTLYPILNETVPDLRESLFEEHHDVIDDWADAEADTRYYARLLDAVEAEASPDGGQVQGLDPDDVPLNTDALQSARENARDSRDAAQLEREGAEERLADLDTFATCIARALQLRALARTAETVDELEQEQAELDQRVTEIRDTIDELETRRDEFKQRVETGELVLKHFDTVEEKRDALSNAADKLQRAEEELADAETEVSDARESVETIEDELEQARDDLTDAQQEHEEAKESLAAINDKQGAAEQAVEHYGTKNDLENEISTLQEGIGQRNKRKSDIQDTIKDLKDDLAQKREKFDGNDLEGIRDKYEDAQERLEKAKSDRKKYQEKLQEAQKRLVDVENELDALERERERANSLDEQIEWADDIVSELTDMIETYEDVKLNLRAQTLDLLNKYTNEVFDDLYHSESYKGIRIDNDYNITLVDSGNETIDPDKGSGGEGVIANIALRAGVYRVIADQDQNGGAGLPPFILDEPTNHLDTVHLGQIEDVIESIEEWDVPQVFVVSHREALIENADNEIYVDKDPATDASTAYVGGPPGEGGE